MDRPTMMIIITGHTHGSDCEHDEDINVGGGIRDGSGPCSVSVDDDDRKDRARTNRGINMESKDRGDD